MKSTWLLVVVLVVTSSLAARAEESACSDAAVASEAPDMVAAAPASEESASDVAELTRIIEEQAALIESLAARITTLESGLTNVLERAVTEGDYPSWAPKIKIGGDLRYRYEHIAEQGKNSRQRDRIRARLALSGRVNGELDFKVRLASGADDPVSTNQTLTGAFSSKDIWLDQAYFDWHPNATVRVFGGKMANPFFTPGGSQLIWDGDLTPEGLALCFTGSGTNQPFLNLAQFWAEERSSGSDARVLGMQGGLKFGSKSTKGTIGLGYYNFTGVKGEPPLFDQTKSFGNSVTKDDEGNLFYATGFRELEAFAQMDWKAGNTPVALYGNWVTNTAADDDDTGWLVGLDLGSTKNPGDWKFGYNYRRLEADAVLGAWCDSDFIGGGTNGKGHAFSITTAIAQNATFGITYLVNDKGLVNSKDYQRLQMDLGFKF